MTYDLFLERLKINTQKDPEKRAVGKLPYGTTLP